MEMTDAEYDGEDLIVGYNAEYLKDVIGHIGGKTVVVRLNTSISATLFNLEDVKKDETDNLMLLMPIRLNV